MKKRYIAAVCGCFFTVSAVSAIEVTTSAGGLSQQVTDKSATVLTVKGAIDARDIDFIADEMGDLTSLDLTDTRIVAHTAAQPLFMTAEKAYAADKLPELAFFGKSYTSLRLPSTLRVVGKGALAGCDALREIDLPASVDTIGDYAFNGCNSLVSVAVPASAKRVGNDAFAHCRKLENADLKAAGSACVWGKNVFASCFSLRKAALSAAMRTVPAGMFMGCRSMTEVELASASALEGIGENAFAYTAVSSFDFGNCPLLRTVGRWAFAGVPLTSVALPESVESIGEAAFFYNSSLASVALPAALTQIENYAFAGCENMENFPALGDNVKTVGSYAFAGNKSLQSALLPASVDSIGNNAFENCIGFDSLRSYAAVPPALGDDVFVGINQPAVTLRVVHDSREAYQAAAQWKEFIIEDIVYTGVDGVQAADAVKAYFDGKTLKITASDVIVSANLYEPSGILLASAQCGTENAEISTDAFVGNYYFVTVKLQNGKAHTIKLKRN